MGIFSFFKSIDINQGIKEYKKIPGAVLVDVRTSQEYKEGHIPDSKNIPLQSLIVDAYKILKKDDVLFVYCRSGSRSKQATNILKQMGYTKVKNIGGILDYKGKMEYEIFHR
ncbi:MAG: rhodanese-like domain-containing protein [Faecalibacillus sp.]